MLHRKCNRGTDAGPETRVLCREGLDLGNEAAYRVGIVMMIIMLGSFGLSDSGIRFFTNDRETFALRSVPIAPGTTSRETRRIHEM